MLYAVCMYVPDGAVDPRVVVRGYEGVHHVTRGGVLCHGADDHRVLLKLGGVVVDVQDVDGDGHIAGGDVGTVT